MYQPEAMMYRIYVPINYNDGKAVPAEIMQHITDHALDLFGGYTMSLPHTGAWRDQETNQVHFDNVRVLAIASYSAELIHRMAEYVRGVLDQKCVLVEGPMGIVEYV